MEVKTTFLRLSGLDLCDPPFALLTWQPLQRRNTRHHRTLQQMMVVPTWMIRPREIPE